MGCIYKITNLLNNKSYIGKTSFSLDVRWNKHLQSYNNSNSHCYNYYLYRAMRKHGISNFNIELLEEISNDSLLNEREQYWIKFYKYSPFLSSTRFLQLSLKVSFYSPLIFIVGVAYSDEFVVIVLESTH